MGRKELSWNNVSANANVGTGAMTAGSKMLASALDNLQDPLDRGNEIVQDNATSERDANTGMLISAINKGENPELSGAYDSNKIAGAQFEYKKYAANEARRVAAEGRAQAASARAGAAHRRRMRDGVNGVSGGEPSVFGAETVETPTAIDPATGTPVKLDPMASSAVIQSDFGQPAETVKPVSYLDAPIGEGAIPVKENIAPTVVTPTDVQPSSAFATFDGRATPGMISPEVAAQIPAEVAPGQPVVEQTVPSAPEVSAEQSHINSQFGNNALGEQRIFDLDAEKDTVTANYKAEMENFKLMDKYPKRYKKGNIRKGKAKLERDYAKTMSTISKSKFEAQEYNKQATRDNNTKVEKLKSNRALFDSALERFGETYTADNAETAGQQEIANLMTDLKTMREDNVITADDQTNGGKLIARIEELQKIENQSVQEQLSSQYGFTTKDEAGNTVKLSPEEKSLTDQIEELEGAKNQTSILQSKKSNIEKQKLEAKRLNEESGYSDTSSAGRYLRGVGNDYRGALNYAWTKTSNAMQDVGDIFRSEEGAKASDKSQQDVLDYYAKKFDTPKSDKKITYGDLNKAELKKQNDNIQVVKSKLVEANKTRLAKEATTKKAIKSGSPDGINTMLTDIRASVDQMAGRIPGGVSASQKRAFVTKQLQAHLTNAKATKAERQEVNAQRKKFDYETKTKQDMALKTHEGKKIIDARFD